MNQPKRYPPPDRHGTPVPPMATTRHGAHGRRWRDAGRKLADLSRVLAPAQEDAAA